MFGGANLKNLQVAKGGCASHATTGAIAELGRAGVKMVNISPVRADGPASVAVEWIPIRPNTDTAMLLALAHTLIAAGRHDRDFLARYTTGFARVLPYVMGETDGQAKDADWASSITGVPADPDSQPRARDGRRTAPWSPPPGRCNVPITASSPTGP